MDTVLWTPPDSRRRASVLWRFAQATRRLHGAAPDDYAALHRWSIAEPGAFWEAIWDFAGIIGDKGGAAFEGGATIRDARFFPGARLNYAENLLRDANDRLALIAEENDGHRRTLTRRGLRDAVSRAMQALAAEGVGKGDRVAGLVSNDLEAAVLYIATAAIGAIWASCSPDFGPQAAVDRLGQIDPAVLVATPRYSYGNKTLATAAAIEAVAAATGVRKIILTRPESRGAPGSGFVDFDNWVGGFAPRPINFERFPFDTPMAILFTSGTTGKPKAMVHSAGGLLLQHRKEHQLHCDLGPADRLFYYTTCGWMMWNWQLSALASGAAIVTYDGDPFHPGPARLVEFIDSDGITVFGTSAKYLQSCEKVGVVPKRRGRLETLRTVLSTGSPLRPESFDHVYRDWKSEVQLASISGGSDICGCFLGGVPTLPVRRGELQGALLGMDVAVFDDAGRTLPAGATGELVCRAPHPSMPLFFWGDADGSRYRAAYFDRFPGVWAHGDFVEARPSGGFVVKGRSDTTLNPGGVRIGTAEIYRQVETIDAIAEAVAVAQDWQGDQRVVLFVRLRPGETLGSDLVELIRRRIRAGATPRHLPAVILAVSDIPRTRSGKISELAVREAIHGRPVANLDSLANPESLALYADLPALMASPAPP